MFNKKFKSGTSVKIIDPYEWLPGYGETNVELNYENGDLYLKILYNDEINSLLRNKTILFKDVCLYNFGWIRDFIMEVIDYSADSASNENTSNLVYYPESEIVEKIIEEYDYLSDIRHYYMYLMGQKCSLTVFCKSVELID